MTPIVLGERNRRRIEPNRHKRSDADKKGAAERHLEQEQASFALRQSLRHAGVSAKLTSAQLQREPFSGRGARVEEFAVDDRFNKHSFWHASLTFDRPVHGPLLLGDGRFMGLGLLQPEQLSGGIFAFSIESGLIENPDPVRLSKSLRRAVMARVGTQYAGARLPYYFSGHTGNSVPADSIRNPHLTYAFDPVSRRLLVIQPEAFGQEVGASCTYFQALSVALDGFSKLHAGPEGTLTLLRSQFTKTDSLIAPARTWESLTPYCVNRHAKKTAAEEVIIRDVLNECSRRGLPRPCITVLNWKAVRGMGLQATLRFEFLRYISGPVILGKTRHHGGGLFRGVKSS